MERNDWYGGQQYTPPQYGEPMQEPEREKKPKRNVSFTTLIVCMLITALVGGGLGSIITLGGQAQASTAQQEPVQQALSPVSTPDGGTGRNDVVTVPSVVSSGGGQTYTKKQIVEMTASSIVGIDVSAEVRNRWMGTGEVATGSGSGIIVSSDGYIITNNHVIDGASKIMVYLNDDTEYEAKLVATDAKTDLAVIKIETTGLKAVIMGDSDALVVGDDVVAIGNPLGELRGTATSGMISALERTIDIEGQTMTLLQTDAAINPGNSGGGLFNDRGELVGVINAKVASSSTEGLGFAIPVNDAKAVIDDLMSLGYVSGRAQLGIYMEEVALTSSQPDSGRSGMEDLFGIFGYGGRGYESYETRVRVTQVVLGSAADKAGIHSGDLILQVGGTEITTVSELSSAIGEYKAGDVANIKIQRDGEEQTLTVTFGEYIPE